MKVQIDSNNKVYVDSNNKILGVNGTVEIPRYRVFEGTTILANVVDLTGAFANIETIADSAMSAAFNNVNFYGDVEFTNLTNIGNSGLSSCFSNSRISTLSFPALEHIVGTSVVSQVCYLSACNNIYFPVLKTSLASGLASCYYNMQNIKNVEFPMLHTVGGSCFQSCFQSSKVETVRFTSLTNISETTIFSSCFSGCSNIKDIYFPALTTTSFGSNINQFNSMFNSSSASTSLTCTLHFPSNLSTTISGLTGYPYFGGNSARIVLAFDLQQTS